MQKTNFKTLDLCMIGVVTAVIVIMAQISIPMPLGVPMTMPNLCHHTSRELYSALKKEL